MIDTHEVELLRFWGDEVLTFRFSMFGVALSKCSYTDEFGILALKLSVKGSNVGKKKGLKKDA